MNHKERLAQILAECRAINEQGANDPESQKKLADLLTEGRSVRAAIESQGQLGELEDFAGRSAGVLPLAGSATFEGFSAAGTTELEQEKSGQVRLAEEYGEGIVTPKLRALIASDEYRKAFRAMLRTPGGQAVPSAAIRTLQEASDSQGGFLVPEDILNQVISREPTPTRLAAKVTQLQTSRDTLVIPKVNYSADDKYTTGMRVAWTGEQPANGAAHRVTDPVFGRAQVSIYTAMLSIPISNDMVEDTGFPLISYLSSKFNETIDLLRDDMILNGTGLGQPSGIIGSIGTGADNVKATKSGTNGSIGTDGTKLVAVAMSLPEQYDDNATWVFNKTSTGSALAQLQDSNHRFLWGAGLQDSGLEVGFRDRMLLGYPVTLSGFAPDIATGAYPMIFGDLRGYYLINRIGFSIQVLRERYAEENQVLVLGRVRFGGQVTEAWKMKALQTSA